MISYYFKENEMGRAKWHSYSYWSCFQQWYYWKSYWMGYHQLCQKYYWNLKWMWMLKYKPVNGWLSIISTEVCWSSSNMEWTLSNENPQQSWWLVWNFLSSVALRVVNITNVNAVILPSKTQIVTLLKSPHADKKSREQFSKKRWSLVWNLCYDSPKWDIGYCSSYVTV